MQGDGHARDNHPVDESGSQESLDGDAAIDISVLAAAGAEPRDDVDGQAGHLLDHALDGGEIERAAAAQHDHGLLAVGPLAEGLHDFVGVAPDHNDVDACVEFIEAVWLLLATVQEIEGVVGPSQKAIDTHTAED